MKGLLLKDFYAATTYLRIFLIVEIIFIVGAAFSPGSSITFFPCIIAGMPAMTLIAYDEQDKWHMYATTLPVRRSALVSVKYLDALIAGGGVILLSALAQTIAMFWRGAFDAEALEELICLSCSLILLPTALLLPFVFRFGAARGRLFCYGIVGMFAAAIGFLNETKASAVVRFLSGMTGSVFIAVSAVASAVIFGLSWLLSIRLYRHRDF